VSGAQAAAHPPTGPSRASRSPSPCFRAFASPFAASRHWNPFSLSISPAALTPQAVELVEDAGYQGALPFLAIKLADLCDQEAPWERAGPAELEDGATGGAAPAPRTSMLRSLMLGAAAPPPAAAASGVAAGAGGGGTSAAIAELLAAAAALRSPQVPASQRGLLNGHVQQARKPGSSSRCGVQGSRGGEAHSAAAVCLQAAAAAAAAKSGAAKRPAGCSLDDVGLRVSDIAQRMLGLVSARGADASMQQGSCLHCDVWRALLRAGGTRACGGTSAVRACHGRSCVKCAHPARPGVV
jgi:hypothetical protein